MNVGRQGKPVEVAGKVGKDASNSFVNQPPPAVGGTGGENTGFRLSFRHSDWRERRPGAEPLDFLLDCLRTFGSLGWLSQMLLILVVGLPQPAIARVFDGRKAEQIQQGWRNAERPWGRRGYL